MRIISWLTETLLAFGEGLCFMELVSWFFDSFVGVFVRLWGVCGEKTWPRFLHSGGDCVLAMLILH